MNKKVVIIGAGGHAHVISDIIKRSGDEVIGYLDDDLSKPGVLGKIEDCQKYIDSLFIIGIGDNEIRKKISEKYSNLKYYNAIHSNAIISEDAIIGEGTIIMANAVINPKAKIGKHCIINTSSVVEHDCIIDDYVHISPNATLCGTVKICNCTHVGAGAVIKNNTGVFAKSIIGAGAVVVKNIEVPGVYVGIPAKLLRR